MNFISRDPARQGAAMSPGLREVEAFGANPGDLRMHVFEPGQRARRCPAVVVLHGCTQTAAGFDEASGWSRLAERHGFVLIYPEQKRSNNEQGCFSWFLPLDVARDGGEAASIRSMVAWAVDGLSVDAGSVFVCGLSAGGAMACAVLATSPDLVAGGAIIAGLPYGAATGVSDALDAMYVGKVKDAGRWGDLVRTASCGWDGAWPTVSIWHGTRDHVVRPINAGELVKQWTNVHRVGAASPEVDGVGPATRRVWRDDAGRGCVTTYTVPDLGHGVPVDDADPPAPFFIPAGLAATRRIAADFGLLEWGKRKSLLSVLSLNT